MSQSDAIGEGSENPSDTAKPNTPSLASFSTAYVEAQCHDSNMTSFIGPLESSLPTGSSPSPRLQRICPLCFPIERPIAFD